MTAAYIEISVNESAAFTKAMLYISTVFTFALRLLCKIDAGLSKIPEVAACMFAVKLIV